MHFDFILGDIHLTYNIMERLRSWLMPRVELHTTFENISNEKKNLVKLGIESAILIINKMITHDKTYEIYVGMLYSFVNEILSIPTFNRYAS